MVPAGKPKIRKFQVVAPEPGGVLGKGTMRRFKEFLRDLATFKAGPAEDGDEVRLATAALLAEAALADGKFGPREEETITWLLARYFDLDSGEAAELTEAARQAAEESVQDFAFTRVIARRFTPEERIGMIEMLWQVAYADGRLHDYESALVRRIAGLIHVTDRDSGAARKRVLTRLGTKGSEAG